MDFSQKRGAFDNPYSIVYSRKFDTAIRDTFLNGLFHQVESGVISMDNQVLLDHLPNSIPLEEVSRSTIHYPTILSRIMSSKATMCRATDTASRVTKIPKLIIKAIEIQLTYMHKNDDTYIQKNVLRKFQLWSEQISFSTILFNLIEFSKFLEEVVSLSNQMFSPKYNNLSYESYSIEMNKINSRSFSAIDLDLIWNRNFLIINHNNNVWIQPRSMILMYHNKISDLISVLLLAQFSAGNAMPTDAFDVTVMFVKELCMLASRYKDKVFHILKVLEGLCIGTTLAEEEEWSNYDFINLITSDLKEKVGFDYYSSGLCRIFQSVDTPFRHELACLSKIIGHPLVNMKAGSKKMYDNVSKEVSIDMSKVMACICHMKREYIKKHVAKFSKWPPSHLTSNKCRKALEMAFILGKDPDSKYISDRFGKVSIDDYTFVELDKAKEFNKLENIIPYLKDKTISLVRSKVWSKYVDGINPTQDWVNTRVLLTYLINPAMVHDHEKYLDKYTQSENLSQLLNYLVIRIVPKEKELKIDYRGFGCKTFEDRARSTIQEKNVSIFLDEFSDEQSMTLSEISLLKRLDALRRLTQAYKGYKVLYIVIDASAWNNMFSSATVDIPMKETLDKIFDTTIFGKTHEAFENTFYYVPDSGGCYYWDGHRGGVEGQNQYTWVWVYIAQTKVALENYNLQYYLFVKGDDLRIMILVPSKEYDLNRTKELKNSLVRRISATAEKFGHKINTEESYGSSRYFAFSKSASLDRVELPQTFRKIQKTYGANNSFINTLDDYIASSFSNGHSATKTAPNYIPTYAVSLFWAIYYISTSIHYSSMTPNQMISLVLTPSILGGFPIIYMHNFPIRAESDLFSPFLGLVHHCREHYIDIYDQLIKFCTTTISLPSTFLKLYRDPYSIPTTAKALPSTVLRNFITPCLKRVSKNKHLLDLIKSATGPENQNVVDCLDSADIKRAKILATCYSCSPQGIMDEMTRKFVSGKSVLELLLIRSSRKRVHKLLFRVVMAEERLQNWRKSKLMSHDGLLKGERSFIHLLTNCPAESAFNVREFAWGHKIHDITMPPLQHQMGICLSNSNTANEWTRKNHFLYQIEEPLQYITYDMREQYAVGNQNPFVGYTTRSGTIDPILHFVENDVILTKVKNLLALLSWVVPTNINDGVLINSNADRLINKLILLFTEVDSTKLAPFRAAKRSGTAQHHMRSPNFRESIVPNTLLNVYTRFSGQSNTHQTLRTSGLHYRINFLHCYCYTATLLFNELNFSFNTALPSEIWGVTTPCDFCNRPIEEEPITFDEVLIDNITIETLKITHINEVSQAILSKSLLAGNIQKFNLPIEGRNIDRNVATYGIMQDTMDRMFYSRRKIQDRVTHNVLSKEGYNIISILTGSEPHHYIGLTEMKSCSIETIMEFFQDMIPEIWHKEVGTYDDDKICEWISLSPIEEIPWYHIIRLLHESGQLEFLIRKMENMLSFRANDCYYNPYNATLYANTWCLQLYTEGILLPGTNLVYLSHYESEQFVHYINSKFLSVICHHIVDLTGHKGLKAVKFKNLNEANITITLTLYMKSLVLWYLYTKIEDDSFLTMSETCKTQGAAYLVLADYIDYSSDELLTWIEQLIDSELDDFDSEHPVFRQVVTGFIVFMSNDDVKNIYNDIHVDMADKFLIDTINKRLAIHITYSSLSEIIGVVRANREFLIEDEDLEYYDYQEILDKSALPSSELNLKLKDNLHISFVGVFGYKEYDAPDEYIPPITITQDYKDYGIVTTADIRKVVGSTNDSPGILLNMLLSIMTTNVLPDHLTVVCFNDGQGGFTSVMNTRTRSSRIYFQTYVDDFTVEVRPNMITQSGRNDICFDMNNEGFYNLCEEATQCKYKNEVDHIDILTSDLEYHPKPDTNYDEMQKFLVELFIMKRSERSLIILAVDFNFPESNCQVIDYIRSHLVNCYLTIPNGQTRKNSGYVIAWDTHLHHSCISIDEVIGPFIQPSNDTCNRYNKFIRRLNIHNEYLYESFLTRKISPYMINNKYLQTQSSIFGAIGINRYSSVTCQPVSLEHSLTFIRDVMIAKTPADILKALQKIGMRPMPLLKSIGQRLRKYTRLARNQSWEPNTRAHRSKILHKMFIICGFIEGPMNCTRGLQSFEINGNKLIYQFTKLYDELHSRDTQSFPLEGMIPPVVNPAYYSRESLYVDFIYGFKIWCNLYGFILSSIDRKKDYETEDIQEEG